MIDNHRVKKKGISRVFAAVGYSMDGLKNAWSREAAFRQVSCMALCFFIMAWYFSDAWETRMLLTLPALALPVVELINSAIEAAVDHTSCEHHPLAKAAKDMASASQLLALMVLIFVWATWLYANHSS
jgi:diacylglycerol kinase (ATP)